MSVVVVGLDHRRAPLDLLGRVAVGDNDLPKELSALRHRANLDESVLLSTCLRTEIYAVVDRFHDAVSEVQSLLADRAGITAADIEPYLSVRFDDDLTGLFRPSDLHSGPPDLSIHFDDDLITHLFSVASGLESAVPGESEVLGQVRRAFERAEAERASGPVLAGLFRHAVRAGRRVRTETGIARGATSFAHAAVELAQSEMHGGLGGVSAVVVGAGDMGAGLVDALLSLPDARRPVQIVVASRTEERAEDLARKAAAGGVVRAVAFEEVGAAVAGADLLVTAVEVTQPLFGTEDLVPGGSRAARPLLVVDLGVPRNVDAAVAGVPGVTVLDMEHLRSAVDRALDDRRDEVERAKSIVVDEVARYRELSRARGAAPVVAALRARMEETRRAELERRRRQLADLSEEQWAQLDAVTRGVLAKLLHEPTVVLKETAGSPRGERLVEALRTLFDL